MEPMNVTLLTFDHSWPQRERSLFTVVTTIFGCLMNGLFLCSFTFDPDIKKMGLVFQACIGLTDILVTTAVLPTSAVILLLGHGGSKSTCHTLQFLTEASTYNYSLFFCMMSIESFFRLCRGSADYIVLTSKRIIIIIILVFFLTFNIAAVGVYLGLDYDCCYRSYSGNLVFRITTNLIFHVIPSVITIFFSISASLKMKHRANTQIHYRTSQQYRNDRYGHYINVFVFILYVGAWLPYLVLAYGYPSTSDSSFYRSIWLGVGRSVFTSAIYGILDRNFRRAFGQLFNYICCKKAISGRMMRQHMRACEYHVATEEVHLHLVHHAINAESPCRPALIPRDTQ